LLTGQAHVARAADFGSCVDDLVDRDRLAIHPDGAYTQHQASSHDPRNADGFTRLGRPWGFANVDFANYLRWETNSGRKEWVLMEDTGPGVVTRWWATGVDDATNANTFRVYVDGAATPVIAKTLTNLLGGDNSGFGSSLNFGTPARGGNLYAPIPYASSVKITWDGPDTHGPGGGDGSPPPPTHNTANALWYNINYQKLAPGTGVTSFQASDPTTHQAKLTAANAVLASPVVGGHVDTQHTASQNLAHGAALTHNLAAGTGAIRRLKVNVSGADQAAALRDTFVELQFDGQRTARVPVGQFFGNGESKDAAAPYNVGQDFHRKVEANGDMTAYWSMPYQSGARVRIVNQSGQTVDVSLEVDSGNWTWDERSMHFHANYRDEDDIRTRSAGGWPGDPNNRTGYSAEGTADWRFVTIRGKGAYVGDTLSIRNSTGGWWGEGDEKIYVDYLDAQGDGSAATPVHRGTGTEDYYGYSFGSSTPFGSPFVNQPRAEGQGSGSGQLTVNSRVRGGLDAIPFDESFKFDMEGWTWNQGEVDYGAVVYWYGTPGASAFTTAADLAADFRAGSQDGDAAEGLADTAGDGQWQYLSSDSANPQGAGAQTSLLTWGSVGNAGNMGYGGGQHGFNLAAISDEFLFVDGGDNIGIQGSPGYHELALHPAGDGFNGDADEPFIVARWIAGASSAGLANISGSIRNLVDNSDSIDFTIYVDGLLAFDAAAAGTTLAETYFDFDVTLAEGSIVDFVVGNNGAGNLFGDESMLRAIIAVPEPSTLVLALSGMALYCRRTKR